MFVVFVTDSSILTEYLKWSSFSPNV